MALGPMLIFDKSTLQSLSQDESVWLENFFLTNITPLFYIETLADLEKEKQSGRSSEDVVGDIARKTPDMSSYPNVHHTSLLSGELQGLEKVDMIYGRVIIAGGQAVSLGDKTGIFHKQAPETEAFQRWQRGQFLDLERLIAKKWRAALSNVNHEENYQLFQRLYNGRQKPKTLAEIKSLVDQTVHNEDGENALQFGLSVIGVPIPSQEKVLQRYRVAGKPPLKNFAPYFCHVFSVDLFFYMSIAADLISRVRPSNKIDLAYLYYLPFCMAFVSNDKLHERVAPLFLREDQTFLKGNELKTDLANLNQHYLKLPDDVKIQGVMRFAPYPPTEGEWLIAKLWDRYLPKWREHKAEQPPGPIGPPPKVPDGLLKEFEQFKKGKPIDPVKRINSDDVHSVVFERKASMYKGNWRRFPPEVENSQKRIFD